MRQALDIYDDYPKDMKRYLRNYGWHFNKKACEAAMDMMRKKDASTGKMKPVQKVTKEEVESMLRTYGVELEHNAGYDAVYVYAMGMADYYGSSITDETHLALFIKDTIDDVDAGDGAVMRCWYAKMVAAGNVVDWEDMV